MDVSQAIQERRAYRSLSPVEITDDLIDDLARSARLSPSCFNNQPWRFVFVRDPEMLIKMRDALSAGNVWAHSASLIIARAIRSLMLPPGLFRSSFIQIFGASGKILWMCTWGVFPIPSSMFSYLIVFNFRYQNLPVE